MHREIKIISQLHFYESRKKNDKRILYDYMNMFKILFIKQYNIFYIKKFMDKGGKISNNKF